MNIIIVNDYCNINGGSDKVAIISAIELGKRGFNVFFFGAAGPICEQLQKSKVNVICLNQQDVWKEKNKIKSFKNGIWNSKSKEELLKFLNNYTNNDTIVHFHGLTKSLTFSVIEAAFEKKYKFVFTLHDYFTACPNGTYYNYRTQKICSYRPLSMACKVCNCDSRHYYHKIWRVLRHEKLTQRRIIKSKINNYIYISETSKNVLKPYLAQDANFYYVKNPVDIEKEEPVDVKNNNNFIYIGRLSKDKGCLLFARAAKEVNLNAIFVGEGELKDEIKRVYPKARITGWVDKNTIKEELENARALIFPSLWYETLGLTALEAQAKGVPVIVSNTCTAREIVKDKKAGLWFKSGDIKDLKEKIETISNNDELTEEYGENAYKSYWENDFSIENHVNQLVKVYEHILERGKI